MFTEVFYKLSKCVSEFWAECSLSFYLSGVWEWQNSRTPELTHTQHMHGYIYPAQQVCSKDSTDGPKDHLSTTCYTKDQHGPRRIILRGLMVEPWSNHIFRAPRRISCILRGYPSIQTTSCCPSQTRRIVYLVNLQTDLGHRLYTDRIQTKYRHKCTNTSRWIESYQRLLR